MKMGGLRKICTVIICGATLLLSACGNTANKSADDTGTKGKKVESVALNRADGSDSTASISEEDYDECRKYIENIYDEIGEYDKRDYANDGDIAEAVDKVAELAETWKEDGTATTVTKHDSYVYIEFANGIRYFFAPASPGTSAVGSDIHVSVYSLQPAKTEFAARNNETQVADDNATDVAAKKIADAYDNYEWEYDLDDKELTLLKVAALGPNEVILWNGHGGWFEECGSTLVLSETIDDVNYIGDDIYYIENDGNYLVTSYFVDSYIKDLSNTFLYLSTCSGLRDTGLADSFKNKGAAAIVANTDVITTIYTSNVMSAVVDGLLEGSDLDSAMALAKEKYGEQDLEFYEDDGALGYAVPTVYWGGDYTFAEESNSFEDGEYQTFKVDNQSGYCDNFITADADGNRTSAAGFYEASIRDGNLYISGGIALHSWNPRNHIEKFYPYSEYEIALSDSCVFEETFVGEIPEETKTMEEMNQLLQQSKTMDTLTLEITNGEVVKLSFSVMEY